MNEPVLTNGLAASIASALIPFLIAAGVKADSAPRVGSWIGAGAVALLALVSLFAARRKVTPVVNPKSAAGVPLIESPAVAAALAEPTAPAEVAAPAVPPQPPV